MPSTNYNKSRKNSPLRMRLNQDSENQNQTIFESRHKPKNPSFFQEIDDFRMERESSNDFFRKS